MNNYRAQSPVTKRVIILGGGFGGLYAALHLDRTIARDPGVEVLLIDPQNFAVFTPMLHEVASGDLDASSIVVPIRQSLRRVRFLEAECNAIDLNARTITIEYGLAAKTRTIAFDQLLIATGSETRFPPGPGLGLGERALGMKTIYDALFLRNWLIGIMERAEIEEDSDIRRSLLTIVVAGGGFSGVETIGAINDFLREAIRHYRTLSPDLLSLVLVHPGDRVLPEFGPALGRYTESKLRKAGIDVRLQTKVASFSDSRVLLDLPGSVPSSSSLAAHTLIWTAGVTPGPLIESLSIEKQRGRIIVSETMAVPGHDGVWACGDCAAVPDANGKPYPTTAQHAMRQGARVGRNIAALARGCADKIRPFRFKMLGQLAAIGRHRGAASIFGFRFSGFFAWFLWRSAYLLKLPRLEKKIRVMLEWSLDLFFTRDTVQMLTPRGVRSVHLHALLAGNNETRSEPMGAPSLAAANGKTGGIPLRLDWKTPS